MSAYAEEENEMTVSIEKIYIKYVCNKTYIYSGIISQ